MLEIEILSLETGPYGWCAFLEGVGLLPDDFPEPYVHHFDLTKGDTTRLCDGVEIPIVPFCGTMGTCPDRPGRFVPFPPHEGGGNMDTRHLIAGTKLYLPVHIPGGRFSFGDSHAAQGDGEVCVAAVECGMKASLRFGLVKGRSTPPWFITKPGSLTPRSDVAGYYGTTGIAPDLMEGARMAVRQMIELLGHEHGLDRKMAYMLCSTCCGAGTRRSSRPRSSSTRRARSPAPATSSTSTRWRRTRAPCAPRPTGWGSRSSR
jgi:acetamidase/formamidase